MSKPEELDERQKRLAAEFQVEGLEEMVTNLESRLEHSVEEYAYMKKWRDHFWRKSLIQEKQIELLFNQLEKLSPKEEVEFSERVPELCGENVMEEK